MDILRLYNEAKHDQLDQQEIAWLESLASKYPWYTLPHTILAKYHIQNHSTIKDRALQKAATYAISRAVLKEYILGPEVAASPPQRVISSLPEPTKVEEILTTEETLDENLQESVVSEEVVHAVDEIAETEQVEAVAEEEIAEEKVAEVPAIAEEAVEKETAESEEIAEIEESEATENAEAIEAESDVAATEIEAEEKPADIPAVIQEAPAIDPKYIVGKVNWYLETRVSMRAAKYVRLGQRLREEMKTFVPAASTNGESKVAVTETTAPITAETPVEAIESAAIETEAKVEVPVMVAEEQKPKKVAAAEEPAEENEYQIGSFSGFTFLAESAAEKDVEEIDSEIIEAEAVESAVGGGDEPTEIIFEERDRVVEITVTAEQLEKYFRGKAPQPKVTAEEAMEPFELGLDSDVLLNNEKPTKEKVEKLIDKFIETDPTLSNPHSFQASKGNLAAKSSKEPDDLVTETLAKIHAMQGNYAKAAKIYKKLSLLFPEKSDYFADQIKNLKK